MNEYHIKSANVRSYALTLLRHHYLLVRNAAEEGQIEKVEDLLATQWQQLSVSEQAHAKGLSSDLNWLLRDFAPPPRGRKKEDVTQDELNEFEHLISKRDPLPLLESIRRCAPALANGAIAIGRAHAYTNLGLPEVAAPFLAASVDLLKASVPSRAAFVMLVHESPSAAFQQSLKVISSPQRYAPVVVAYSIQFCLDFLWYGGDIVTRESAQKLLADARSRLSEEPTPKEDQGTFFRLAGSQMLYFGATKEAASYLSEALQLEPDNVEVLGQFAEATYESDPEQGAILFRKVISLRAGDPRACLRLAQHYLAGSEYEMALFYAGKAAETAKAPRAQATASEVLAICFSAQHSSPHVVHPLLSRAARLDPENPRLSQHLDRYGTMVADLVRQSVSSGGGIPTSAFDGWRGENYKSE